MIAYNQIYDNTSVYYGGGIFAYQCTLSLVNNTITQNECTSSTSAAKGGGICTYGNASYSGRNNIIYDNQATNSPEVFGTVNISYTCCSTTLSGNGNITDNPEFFEPELDDFYLLAYSTCIDSGDPDSPLDPDSTRADMGALFFDQSSGAMYAPNAPIDFSIAHNNAALIASLSWINPTLQANLDPLTELLGVKVYREGALVANLTDVLIGQPYDYDDSTVPSPGLYEYELVPYNSFGDGYTAGESAWIGLDTPGEPNDVVATPDPGQGLECTITWSTPTEGGHGGYWFTGSWTGQRVYRDGMEIADLPGTNTSYVDNNVPIAGFYSYGVSYYNTSGEGPLASAFPDPVFVGPPLFEQIPYDWVEIAAIGTNTGITWDDQVVGPFGIGFDFPFYDGINYNRIWVCSNGWTSFSSVSYGAYNNVAIPNSTSPNNMVCPFWDDLTPDAGSRVMYYFDEPNDRFIIEFMDVPHYGTGGNYTFEMILYPNGDVDFMYNDLTPGTANSATVGVENASGTDGIQVTYNGSGPLEPQNEMGIRVYAVEPPTGVEDEELVQTSVIPTEFALNPVYPNPFNPVTTISFALPEARRVTLSVYDISGRLVATVVNGWRDAGIHQLTFDGSNLASGVYVYRMDAGKFTASGKMIMMK